MPISDEPIVHALYRKLLALYPPAFRKRFGQSMQDTFADMYRARTRSGLAAGGLLLRASIDTAVAALHERLRMHFAPQQPLTASLSGFLFAVPFLLANASIATRWEPLNSILRGAGLNNIGGWGPGFFFVAGLLLLLPLGAYVSLQPVRQRKRVSRRHWHNVAIAVILIVGFVSISGALGAELYQCQVTPYCD
ncbi:MAG: hypothetical protein KIS88_06220 [Anaerolineales bacterium]|nr:hypothetical protein [Anaerolineales bacterium]